MESLSITKPILDTQTLTIQCVEAFSSLRNVRNVIPGRLHALNNEVTHTNAVLKDVSELLAERGQHSISHEDQANIPHVVARLNFKLKSVIDALAASCSRSKMPFVQARAWSKVQGKLLGLQEDIKAAKTRLNVRIGASNSGDLLHIRIQVDVITTNTVMSTRLQQDLREDILGIVEKHQGDMSLSLDKVATTVGKRLERIEELISAQEARFYESQENMLGPPYGVAAQHRRRRSRARKSDAQLPARVDAVGVRFSRYATTCRSGCTCSCHKENRSHTPTFFDRVFGRLFLGYSGVPGLSKKCNDASCEKSQTARINMEY